MITVRLIMAFSIPIIFGYLLITFLSGKDSEYGILERTSLGLGLGLGSLSLWIFLAGILRIPYSFFTLSLFPVIATTLLLFTLMSSKTILFPSTTSRDLSTRTTPLAMIQTFLASFAAASLAFKILFVFYGGLNIPMLSWDTWANWSAGAKFFYYRQGLALDMSDPGFFGNGYRVYLGHPLLTPLLQVWTAQWLGEFHEALVKAWAPLYFSGLLGIFFCAVRRETSPRAALISTFMLSSVPLLTFHATEAYSDLPLGYNAFAACVCFWTFIRSGKRHSLVLSGIFSGLSVFTKNEGLFFAGAITVALLIYCFIEKKAIKTHLFYFMSAFVLTAGPWLSLKASYGLGYGHELSQQFVGLALTISALKEMGKVMFFETNFNMVFLFLLSTVVLNPRTIAKEKTKYLFLVLSIVAAAFFSVYVMNIQEYNESLIGRLAVNRNILTYIALVYFLAALCGYSLWKRGTSSDRGD